MMPLGESHLVSFYRHPRIISLDSGEVVASWEDLATGNQVSSIRAQDSKIIPIALDPQNYRFAVYGPDGINVIQVDLGAA